MCSEGALSQDGKIAVASSVTVFVMAFLLIIVGFLCGHCCQMNRETAPEILPYSGETYTHNIYTPYYDDVVPKR